MSLIEREIMHYWRAVRHFRLTGCPESREEIEAMACNSENARILADVCRLVTAGCVS